jgi:hypothetical protein
VIRRIETDAPHGTVRLYRMSQQVAGTEFRTKRTLIASRPGNTNRFLPIPKFPLNDKVILRQNNDPASRFRNRLGQIGFKVSHHYAADDKRRLFDGDSARFFNAPGKRRSNRNTKRAGMSDISRYGNEFLRNRFSFRGGGNIACCFNIHHNGSDGKRNPAGRNDSAERFINQDKFVASGVRIVQRSDLHIADQLRVERFDSMFVFPLNTNNSRFRSCELHSNCQTVDELFGAVLDQFFIFMQERFTLGSVDDNGICFAGEFNMGRKSRSAGSNNTRFCNFVYHLSLKPIGTN